MFKWLKSLFGKKEEAAETVYPFPTAKGQDQSSMAPYKVEPPVVEPVKDQVTDAVTATPKKPAAKRPAPKQVKKPTAPKKKPVAVGKPAGTRGRKPKAKTVN